MSDLLQQATDFAKQGQYRAALGLFQELGGANGAYGEAACLHRLNLDDEAREAIERCLDLDPFHDKAQSLLRKLRPAPRTRRAVTREPSQFFTPARLLICGALAVVAIIFFVMMNIERPVDLSLESAPNISQLYDALNDCVICGGRGEVPCVFCINGITDCPICTSGCTLCNGRGSNTCTFCDGTNRTRCTFCDGTGK